MEEFSYTCDAILCPTFPQPGATDLGSFLVVHTSGFRLNFKKLLSLYSAFSSFVIVVSEGVLCSVSTK